MELRNVRLFTIVLFISFFFSCKKDNDEVKKVDPDICFEITEGNLYAEMGINFDASCSKTSKFYFWSFGDGEKATGVNVSHVYEKEGEYKVIFSVGNNQDSLKTMEKTINVLPSPFIKHCGDINGDEVWNEGMHLVTCNINVNGSLTIKPGAKIYLEENKSLKINGKFIAQGTADKLIKFIPSNNTTTPGSWGYIHFTPTTSSESIMDYCEVKYGGDAGFNGYPDWEYNTKFGVIHLNECVVSINHTTIEGAENFGISLTKKAKFKSFENNTFVGNKNNPLKIYANAVQTIGKTSSFSGEKSILVVGDEYFNPGTDIVWYKQNVPYCIDGSIGFYGNFNMTIEAGTIIELASNGMMNVGYFNTSAGSITAIGTQTEPIKFTSAKVQKNRGDWAGLLISKSSVIENCIIEYAGADYTASGYNRALQVSGTGAKVNNCTIQECSGYGLELEATSATITNNTIKNCNDYAVYVDLKNYRIFDKSNIIENTGGFFISSGGGSNLNATLEKRVYPYITNYLSFYVNATLTIEPGTEIQLRSGTSINMGYNNSSTYSGNLIANGTAESPIIFSLYYKDKEAGKGNWGAIVFGEESTTSVLNNCIISDGGNVIDGNSQTHPQMGMIHCYKTANFPTITNCTIKNSSTYGITKQTATINSLANIFLNNSKGDEYSY